MNRLEELQEKINEATNDLTNELEELFEIMFVDDLVYKIENFIDLKIEMNNLLLEANNE